MKPRILLVDDERAVLDGYRRILHRHFEIDTAESGQSGLDLVSGGATYAVIVSDMRMPAMNGAEFLSRVRKMSPDSSRILLTGYAEVDAAIAAINEGQILRFLTKPCPEPRLVQALTAGAEQHRLVTAERDLLEHTLTGMISVLAEVLGLVNPGAFGCATRLRNYVRHMAAELGLESAWRFEVAALLSHLGCVTLHPETVDYANAGKTLSPEEQARFSAHPGIARDLLLKVPRMEPIAWIIAQQLKDETSLRSLSPDDQQIVKKGVQLLRTAVAYDSLLARGHSSEQAIASMRRPGQPFPPDLVSSLANLKSTALTEVRRYDVSDLACGMVLHQEVRTNTGLLVVNDGQEVTFTLLERLKSFAEKKTIPPHVLVRVPKTEPVEVQVH